MIKKCIAITTFAALLVGCGTARSPVVSADKKIQTGLTLVHASGRPGDKTEVLGNSISALSDNEKTQRGFDFSKEKSIINSCLGIPVSDTQAQAAGAVAMALGFVVDKTLSFVLDKVEEEIAKVIEEHSATYGASTNTNQFYKQAPRTSLKYSCFRFSRGKPNQLPTMDVIGQWRTSDDGGAMEVRILRVFYREKVAKRGSKIGISIGLKANATWQEGNEGKQADTFDKPIFSGKFDFDKENEKFFVYPSHVDATGQLKSFEKSSTQLPLPSWSDPKPTTNSYGNVRISVNVAEVAKPSKSLKIIQSLFKDNKDKIKGLLQSAANEALGIETK